MNRSRARHGDARREPNEFQKEVLAYLNDIQDGQKELARMIGRSFQGIVQSVEEIGEEIMTELSDAVDSIEAGAEADGNADNAAMAMLVKLSDLVKATAANGTDPAMVARINAVAAAMKARAQALADAVVANTPADPTTGGSTGGIGGSTGGV